MFPDKKNKTGKKQGRTIICRNCFTENDIDNKKCKKCGEPLEIFPEGRFNNFKKD